MIQVMLTVPGALPIELQAHGIEDPAGFEPATSGNAAWIRSIWR